MNIRLTRAISAASAWAASVHERLPTWTRQRRLPLAVAFLFVPLACLAAVNLFLNVSLPQLINGRQDRVHIDYAAAWMIVPGHVRIRGLRIRADGQRERWHVEAAHASAWVALSELPTRTLHASRVRGRGVRLQHWPHEGAPPGQEPQWSVRLDDIQATDIDEIAAAEYRLSGPATATADVIIAAPLVDASGTLSLLDAGVDLGDTPVARGLMGDIRFAIDALDRRQDATERVQSVSGHAAIAADVQDLRFLERYLKALPWLSVVGTGHATVDLVVEKGRLEPDSTVSATFPALVVRVLSNDVSGTGEVRGAVIHEPGSPPELRVDIDFEDFAIMPHGGTGTLAEGSGFHVGLQSPDMALDALMTNVRAELDLPSSRIPDVAVYNGTLPEGIGLALLGGEATAHGRVVATGPGNHASGEVFVDGNELHAQLDALSITGDLELHAVLVDARLDTGRYDLSGSQLGLKNVGVVDHDRPDDSDGERLWWASIAVDDGTIQVGAPVYLDAQLRLDCQDSAPFVAAFAQKKSLPRWAQGALSVQDVAGEARLQLGPTTLALGPCEVRGGSHYQINLDYRRDGSVVQGALLARAGALSLGLELGANRSGLKLFGATKWFEQQTQAHP